MDRVIARCSNRHCLWLFVTGRRRSIASDVKRVPIEDVLKRLCTLDLPDDERHLYQRLTAGAMLADVSIRYYLTIGPK
ncbi:hypothetical protein SHAM105786_08635 [Shewanella amazonensis]